MYQTGFTNLLITFLLFGFETFSLISRNFFIYQVIYFRVFEDFRSGTRTQETEVALGWDFLGWDFSFWARSKNPREWGSGIWDLWKSRKNFQPIWNRKTPKNPQKTQTRRFYPKCQIRGLLTKLPGFRSREFWVLVSPGFFGEGDFSGMGIFSFDEISRFLC